MTRLDTVTTPEPLLLSGNSSKFQLGVYDRTVRFEMRGRNYNTEGFLNESEAFAHLSVAEAFDLGRLLFDAAAKVDAHTFEAE